MGFWLDWIKNTNIEPPITHSRLVRVSKRLVRYNTMEDYVEQDNAKPVRYSCEKCGKVFGAWKYLRQHKVDNHSY